MLHLVTAIIKPHKLDDVKTALREAGVLGIQSLLHGLEHLLLVFGQRHRSTSLARPSPVRTNVRFEKFERRLPSAPTSYSSVT